jgi:hypothetical protein
MPKMELRSECVRNLDREQLPKERVRIGLSQSLVQAMLVPV